MNPPHAPLQDGPRLSPDFAARVVRRADAVRARRRRVRRALAGAAIGAAGAIAIGLSLPSSHSPRVPVQLSETAAVGSTNAEWVLLPSSSDSANPLGYLFPEVAPLAGFVNRYSAVVDGIRVREQVYPAQVGNDDDASQ